MSDVLMTYYSMVDIQCIQLLDADRWAVLSEALEIIGFRPWHQTETKVDIQALAGCIRNVEGEKISRLKDWIQDRDIPPLCMNARHRMRLAGFDPDVMHMLVHAMDTTVHLQCADVTLSLQQPNHSTREVRVMVSVGSVVLTIDPDGRQWMAMDDMSETLALSLIGRPATAVFEHQLWGDAPPIVRGVEEGDGGIEIDFVEI